MSLSETNVDWDCGAVMQTDEENYKEHRHKYRYLVEQCLQELGMCTVKQLTENKKSSKLTDSVTENGGHRNCNNTHTSDVRWCN